MLESLSLDKASDRRQRSEICLRDLVVADRYSELGFDKHHQLQHSQRVDDSVLEKRIGIEEFVARACVEEILQDIFARPCDDFVLGHISSRPGYDELGSERKRLRRAIGPWVLSRD